MMLLPTISWMGCNDASFSKGEKTKTTTDGTRVPVNSTGTDSDNVHDWNKGGCHDKLAVVLVMDVSDSMKEPDGGDAAAAKRKIDVSIAAAKEFVQTFDAQDMLALVTFSTEVKTATNLTTDRTEILAAIDQMTPDGFTNIAGALQHAGGILADISKDLTFKKMIVFMSDGTQTSHQDGPPIPVATEIKAAGIDIITLGYDLSGDKTAMQTIATQQDMYYDAQNGSSLQAGFRDIAKNLCRQ